MAATYQNRNILGSQSIVVAQEATSGELKVTAYGKTAGGVITALLVDAAGKLIAST